MAKMAMPRAIALAFVLTCAACLPWAAAQETPKEGEAQIKPADSYKVEFTVNELDNGKKINSRSYSMQIRAEAVAKWTDMKRLRVGSQVPVATGSSGGFHYMDVGMNIDCRLLPMGNGKVAIGTNWEYSSVEGEQVHEAPNPVMRHVRSEVEAVIPLDKATVISEMDDVASTHHFVFEVKVTKITP
ncbi:MAG TPA: hypothetical protein VKO18_02275, partial [Terriglobia bacterium]|nr:hypothetical protein [Terriglobia bacterium]